ncbi:MAG: phage/plasmid primase, P4 family [Lysobacteraceae bacterium]
MSTFPMVPQREGAHDPCSHLANAHRLKNHFGDRLLFVEGIGWHVWSPPWKPNDLGARRLVHGLGQIIAAEAAGMAAWVAEAPDKAERQQREDAMQRRFKWASASESARGIEDSLRVAQSLFACKAEELDADPDLLGMPSGVLELETGKHRAHRQSDRITKVAGCEFSSQAMAPTWEKFVGEAMGGDAELIDFVQRLAGYALSGRRDSHILPILWGSGANGKSTFLGTLQAVLGEYAGNAAPGLLIQKHGTDHPTGLADLQGKRLVIVSETGESGRLNEEQVKLLTGGDKITARRMRMDFYTFQPTHLLLLQTNHKPRVAGVDEGIWRRLRLVPFAVTIPPERRDPALPEKLRAELPGILTWCWQGWQRYLVHGFNDPAAVRSATAEYRDASDQVGAFLDECCEVDAGFTVTAKDLYCAYRTWAQENGERERTQRDFGMRLSERGFERVKYGSGHRWRGLRVGDSSDPYDPNFGLSASCARAESINTEKPSHRSLQSLPADAYHAAKDGDA